MWTSPKLSDVGGESEESGRSPEKMVPLVGSRTKPSWSSKAGVPCLHYYTHGQGGGDEEYSGEPISL